MQIFYVFAKEKIVVKPRMCFTLLFANGNFHLSRNFQLQTVGNFDWLMENYELESIARSIDELLILNVSREDHDWDDFVRNINQVIKHCFMPVAVGGGIRSLEHVKLLFGNGADKVVLNNAIFKMPTLVSDIVGLYGSQSIVASLDFRRDSDGVARIFVDGGAENTGIDLSNAVRLLKECGVGELYLTSIDRDGTGMGYDLPALELAYNECGLPIIASGGADTSDQLAEGISSGFVSAVSTSHLFNFMGDGLRDARQEMVEDGIQLTQWDFSGVSQID